MDPRVRDAGDIIALDTQYHDDQDVAWTGFVRFEGWSAPAPSEEGRRQTTRLAPYEPGQFYRRELPCLRAVLDAEPPASIVVVDGYVDLGPDRPGLGRHLYNAYDGAFEVVGVAKNPFVGAPSIEVLRGESRRPLYVTATYNSEDAARAIEAMVGDSRLPDLLRRVDHLARGLP